MRASKRALGSNLAKLDATTDQEIARQIVEDPDTAPELTDEWLDHSERWEGDRFIGRVGRPKGSGKKEMVTLRLDRDVIELFRASGPGWQTRLNDALRAVPQAQPEITRRNLPGITEHEQRRPRIDLLKYLRIAAEDGTVMHLDLTDEETRAVLNLLIETIENDHYPSSPRIRVLREIVGKFGDVGGLSPEIAARLRRYAPPPPARLPTPEERAPTRVPRQGRRSRR